MSQLGPMEGFIFVVLLIAVVTDLRSQRIPNGITLPLWPIGILWHLFFFQTEWYFGILGLLIAFPIHFGLWAIGLDKGGDAKLMIGIGACLGWVTMLEATIWSILALLPVGLVYVIVRGRLKNFAKSVKYALLLPYYKAMKLEPPPAPEQTYMPKAPLIAISTTLAVSTDVLLNIGG